MSDVLVPVDEADEHRHEPTGDPLWQESWFLVWNDMHAQAAGYHHFGVQPNRGVSDVWSWLAIDGAVAGRFQSHQLPLPSGDFTDIDVGGIACRSVEAFREYAIEITYPGSTATASLTFQPLTEPMSFSWNKTGGTLGSSHYEFVGRLRGQVSLGGSRSEIDTFALMDRSWGARDLGTLLSHRAIQAFFGEDLFCSVHAFTTKSGTNGLGWIYDDGAFHHVTRTQFKVEIAQDGHSPLSCDVRFFTADGRGYHLRGTVDFSSPTYQSPHYFPTTGMGTFELGGRLASGYLEVNEMAVPSPALRLEMGLSGAEGDS